MDSVQDNRILFYLQAFLILDQFSRLHIYVCYICKHPAESRAQHTYISAVTSTLRAGAPASGHGSHPHHGFVMSLWTCYWVSLSLRSLAAKECSLSLHLNVFEFYFNWLETAAILWRSSKRCSQKVTLTSFRIPVFSIREQGRFQWVTWFRNQPPCLSEQTNILSKMLRKKLCMYLNDFPLFNYYFSAPCFVCIRELTSQILSLSGPHQCSF